MPNKRLLCITAHEHAAQREEWRVGNWRGIAASILLVTSTVHAETAQPSASGVATPVAITPFAVIGADSISREEFQAALHEGMRRTFFHGTPQPEQLIAYRREVTQRLIDRVLLRQEIKRRGIVADAATVDAELLKTEQRLAGNPQWAQDRERALPLLRGR